MAAKSAPPHGAPSSDAAVKVSLIDTTMDLKASLCKIMWAPEIKGFETLECGTFSFLVEHGSRKLLYDLGCRKDWDKLPPALDLEAMTQGGMASLSVEKNISEILTEGGVKLEDIEGIIWSHWSACVSLCQIGG